MKINFLNWFKWIVISLVIFFVAILTLTSCCTTPPCCIQPIIQQQIEKAYNIPGTTVVSENNENFKSGYVLRDKTFLGIIGGEGKIIFECSSELDGYCSAPGTEVNVTKNFDAVVKACCKVQQQECYVMIGNDQLTC